MAVLGESDRATLFSDWADEASRTRQQVTLVKADLRAAIDAVDDWVDTNAGAFNSALPAAAQAGLTAKQKAELLLFVVRRRWEIS